MPNETALAAKQHNSDMKAKFDRPRKAGLFRKVAATAVIRMLVVLEIALLRPRRLSQRTAQRQAV
ncbi:MAG: hypothetical protein OXI87_23480 [Albidovulum sp.]|nr:hypothetical protein [Albidovulum sp.]